MDGPDADGPIDAVDAVVLGAVRSMWDAADPMPDDLVPHIEFAIDLAAPGEEFLRVSARHELAGARGEQARLITFTGTEITVLVDITGNADDSVRIDGWITPPAQVRVELRTAARTHRTSSDTGGRFAFDAVPHGLAQLHVRAPKGVTTPSIML